MKVLYVPTGVNIFGGWKEFTTGFVYGVTTQLESLTGAFPAVLQKKHLSQLKAISTLPQNRMNKSWGVLISLLDDLPKGNGIVVWSTDMFDPEKDDVEKGAAFTERVSQYIAQNVRENE